MTAPKRPSEQALVVPDWFDIEARVLTALDRLSRAHRDELLVVPGSILENYAAKYCEVIYRPENLPQEPLSEAEFKRAWRSRTRSPRAYLYRSASETRAQFDDIRAKAEALLSAIQLLGRPGMEAFWSYKAEHPSPVDGHSIVSSGAAAIDNVAWVRGAAEALSREEIGKSRPAREPSVVAEEIADLAATHYAHVARRRPSGALRGIGSARSRVPILFSEYLQEIYEATGLAVKGRAVERDAKSAAGRWSANNPERGR